jgi:GDP-4-dehydro-6-deoxy-D-mannose reductase
LKPQKKLLATGQSGFVGSALASYLQAGHAPDVELCNVVEFHDLLEPGSLRQMAQTYRPDWIIHLAAQSHVADSWNDPAATLQVNTTGTANLLKALQDTGFQGRLLYVSSADVYGKVPADQMPVTESREPAPRSPYGASKVGAEVLCRQWARTRPLDVLIARPFNHTGPGQRPDFALSGFAREIAAIKLGLQPARIAVGDLDVTRDYLDVRDVLAAYLALLRSGQTGEIYNVCSGRESNLRQTLDLLMQIAGVQAQVVQDPQRLRPAEQRRMCGSHERLTAATGWQPSIELRDTLRQLLDYWTQELKK